MKSIRKKLKKIDVKQYFGLMLGASIAIFPNIDGGGLNVFMVAFCTVIAGTALFVARDLISIGFIKRGLANIFIKKHS